MSSCFMLSQSRSIHMMCDAMAYENDGTIVSNNLNKAVSLATFPAVITALGPIDFVRNFTKSIESRFSSFDEMIDEGSDWLLGTFEGLADLMYDGDAFTTVYMIGWHARENRPGGYFVNFWTDQSTKMREMRQRNPDDIEQAELSRSEFQPVELGELSGSPLYGQASFDEAKFEFRQADEYIPSVDLLHLTEIARHSLHADGTSRQGGKAVLSTVDATGIAQRVVHHWIEDDNLVGQTLRPDPISWTGWREARLRSLGRSPAPSIDFTALSRLQRERMQKKLGKRRLP